MESRTIQESSVAVKTDKPNIVVIKKFKIIFFVYGAIPLLLDKAKA